MGGALWWECFLFIIGQIITIIHSCLVILAPLVVKSVQMCFIHVYMYLYAHEKPRVCTLLVQAMDSLNK